MCESRDPKTTPPLSVVFGSRLSHITPAPKARPVVGVLRLEVGKARLVWQAIAEI